MHLHVEIRMFTAALATASTFLPVAHATPPSRPIFLGVRGRANSTPWIAAAGAFVQIVVDRTGRIVVAWDEFVGGRRVAAARELKVPQNGDVTFGPLVELAPESAAMYPVLAATDKAIVAVWTTGGETPSVALRVVRLPETIRCEAPSLDFSGRTTLRTRSAHTAHVWFKHRVGQ
jgi:hypothetical protein